jgi:lipoprotein-anchoring transpeptidase ErfK/SrfK
MKGFSAVMWHKRDSITGNLLGCLVALLSLSALGAPVGAQTYVNGDQGQWQHPYWTERGAYAQNGYGERDRRMAQYAPSAPPYANLQYDERDAEAILRDQMARTMNQPRTSQANVQPQQEMYDNYAYGHRINDEDQVRAVMAEARHIASMIKKRNGKPFIVIDKRNYQFYLYDRSGRLLRIGPVAIGKGRTNVGAFETPVGVFPIRSKVPVADWIRPDWYFIEEREPIPQRWEDRRVPGFFRYKLVFDGSRYIHYAEATGGRLTHGCLGLDWQDAEAVFHTLDVGSYTIVVDNPFLSRLARGEFPIKKPSKPKEPESVSATITAKADAEEPETGEKVFGSMW